MAVVVGHWGSAPFDVAQELMCIAVNHSQSFHRASHQYVCLNKLTREAHFLPRCM